MIKNLKYRLSRKCYFKSITRNARLDMLNSFEHDAAGVDGAAAVSLYRDRVNTVSSFKNDPWKIFLLIVQLLNIVFGAVMLVSVPRPFVTLFAVSLVLHAALYAAFLIAFILGAATKKINPKEYAYHYIVLGVQLAVTSSAFLCFLYALASSLSSF